MVKPGRDSALLPRVTCLPFDALLGAMGHIPVSQIQDVMGLGKRQWDEKKSSYWQRLLQTEGNFQKYQGPDLCLHNSKWAMHCFGFQKFQLGTFISQIIEGQKLFCDVGVLLMKKITPQHQHMPPPAPFRFRRRAAWISLDKRPDPQDHCEMFHFLLFPLPPRGMRKPKQNT